MKNIPQKIYLQIGDDDLSEVADDFNELSEVSWCHDKVYEHDIEYVIATQTAALQNRVKELEGELERVKGMLEDAVRSELFSQHYHHEPALSQPDFLDLVERDWQQFKQEHNL